MNDDELFMAGFDRPTRAKRGHATVTITLTKEQKREYLARGGVRWLRKSLSESETLAAYTAAVRRAALEEAAQACEMAPFTGNVFPRTQLEQLRIDCVEAICALADPATPPKEQA